MTCGDLVSSHLRTRHHPQASPAPRESELARSPMSRSTPSKVGGHSRYYYYVVQFLWVYFNITLYTYSVWLNHDLVCSLWMYLCVALCICFEYAQPSLCAGPLFVKIHSYDAASKSPSLFVTDFDVMLTHLEDIVKDYLLVHHHLLCNIQWMA